MAYHVNKYNDYPTFKVAIEALTVDKLIWLLKLGPSEFIVLSKD